MGASGPILSNIVLCVDSVLSLTELDRFDAGNVAMIGPSEILDSV